MHAEEFRYLTITGAITTMIVIWVNSLLPFIQDALAQYAVLVLLGFGLVYGSLHLNKEERDNSEQWMTNVAALSGSFFIVYANYFRNNQLPKDDMQPFFYSVQILALCFVMLNVKNKAGGGGFFKTMFDESTEVTM